jgi:hypothetical protein
MATNIADWLDYWENQWRGSFDKDLYIAYLIAKQNKDDE